MKSNIALVGSRTTVERNARGVGLSLWDKATTPWTQVEALSLTNPSWITEGKESVYYVLHGDFDEVSVVEISNDSELRVLQTIKCRGINPVHAAIVDETLIVANYATGGVAYFAVDENGLLRFKRLVDLNEEYRRFRGYAADGPAHPHQIVEWKEMNCLLVPDKGQDALFLIRNSVVIDVVPTKPGSGPRHAVINRDKPGMVYIVGELDSTLMLYRAESDCSVQLLETYPTLPAGFANLMESESTASGIVNSGTNIYVSNRGHDSIAAFQIQSDGRLCPSQIVDADGAFPRFISFVGEDLFVAHEYGDSISRFEISFDGRLVNPVRVAETGSPVCITETQTINS